MHSLQGAEQERLLLSLEGLATLLQMLRAQGYQLVGPTVRDGAIVHAEIDGVEDLPAGVSEVQDAGTYRLAQRSDRALFGYSLGPQSWKQLFFVPRLRLFQAKREGTSFSIKLEEPREARLALIGVRSCDLHAIEIQDRIFLRGSSTDADYAARRQDVFVIAVQCGQAGGSCFCASMQTGPRASAGFDLALTELLDEDHRFLVEVGSALGAQLMAQLTQRAAPASDCDKADALLAQTAASMPRKLETDGIKELLYRNLEHPRWDDVAQRCLGCTNCTLVCPTCFCSSVEDVTDLHGEQTERWRRWDSCFTLDHSHLHGGSVRSGLRARYRQWLVHKLASWIDQFGSSGCVGCGRCITWCPVGIDITAELSAIRAADGQRTA